MKMKLKKVLGLLLSAVLAMQVAGCSGTQTAKKGEDPNTVPEDTYEIQWYMQGVAQNDIDSVEAKINEYLKDKINATVNIVILESGQYEQKMSNMIAASEYFDIAFAASYRLDYMVNAGLGAFVALDDYLDTYLKDIAAELPESAKTESEESVLLEPIRFRYSTEAVVDEPVKEEPVEIAEHVEETPAAEPKPHRSRRRHKGENAENKEANEPKEAILPPKAEKKPTKAEKCAAQGTDRAAGEQG